MKNQAIATMMTYFGSTDHGLGTEVDRGRGGTSSKNRLELPLIYIYKHVWLNNKDTFCLYSFIRILSSFRTSVFVLGWSWLMNLLKLPLALSDPSLAIIRGCLQV